MHELLVYLLKITKRYVLKMLYQSFFLHFIDLKYYLIFLYLNIKLKHFNYLLRIQT